MTDSFSAPSPELIHQMPKAELHRHMAGCITPEILLELNRHFHVPLPAVTADKLKELAVLTRPMRSLEEVLKRFELYADVCISAEVIRYIARRVVLDAARDNVRYFEMRFSPGFLAYRHDLALGEVVEAVIEGATDGGREGGVIVPLIAIASREMGATVCRRTFDLARRYQPHIVGVDLAGNEGGYPPSLFGETFESLRETGLRVTIHAGEQDHAENVRQAIELLGAERIGHGIQIVHHPELMRLVKERDVPLEISITSNYIVGAVSSPEEHPVSRLVLEGVPVTINSDDPGLFGVTLSGELGIYARTCQRSLGDLVQDQLNTLDYGFGAEVDKGIVRQQLHTWWTNI